MKHKQKTFRLAPIAAALAALSAPSAVLAQESNSIMLEEVIVTARKRAESVMDIPASVQALSEEDLKNMGATGIEDYSRFTPSVNVVSRSAAESEIVFRGANTSPGAYITPSSTSLYLDEISLTGPSGQPSIRMVDINRVEALAGPQGTLYGADSQTGTMRVITNKPAMNEFEAILDVSASATEGSSSLSYDTSLVLNLPLVDDKLALRVVAFSSREGGYIDNVLGHTWDTIVTGGNVPANYGQLTNAHAVEKNHNDADVQGIRASLLWDINENWSATLSAMHQEINQGADNFYDNYLSSGDDLDIVSFQDTSTDDEFSLYSLVVEGDLGFAQLVSATSYTERNYEHFGDITSYHRQYNAYYCQGDVEYYAGTYYDNPAGNIYNPSYCNTPNTEDDYLAAYDEPRYTDRFTTELRLSDQGDTLDWLIGAFYEEDTDDFEYFWAYPTHTSAYPNGRPGYDLYQDSLSLASWEFNNGLTSPDANSWWYENNHRESEQIAIFGETVWHLTDTVNLTIGARWFDRDNSVLYFESKPFGNPDNLAAGGEERKGNMEKVIPKVSVSWNYSDDGMVYALWTEGYRPGGTNRTRGVPFFPSEYDGDLMTNTEIGLKTTFAEGAGRFNLTAYNMDWTDYQFELVDPASTPCPDEGNPIDGVCGQPWQNVVANAGDAHITGVTAELELALSQNLVVGANAEWHEAEADTDIDLNGDGELTDRSDIQKGKSLPLSAEWTGAAWATYNFPVASLDGEGYVRLQWSYNGETRSSLQGAKPGEEADDQNPSFVNDAYNIGDLKVGVTTESYEAMFYVNNLTNEIAQYDQGTYAEYGKGSSQAGTVHTGNVYINRPREVGVRLIMNW